MRTNQSRVAQNLLVEAPELLLKLRLVDGVVMVSGDPVYFPALSDGDVRASLSGASEMPLAKWLKSANSDTAKYFEGCIVLYGLLVDGRNEQPDYR